MHVQASGPVARCAQCREIKVKHYEAVRQGQMRRAEAMAATMGRHLRAAHS